MSGLDGHRRRPASTKLSALTAAAAAALAVLAGCGGGDEAGDAGGGRPGGFGGPPGATAAAVPVEVATVERRQISSYIETNGTLEAENEVDVVARISAPIIELSAEEGMRVARGQVLARLDQAELRAQVEITRANLLEAEQNYQRAVRLQESQLLSAEAFEQAFTRYETSKAELEGREIQLGYTVIRAPFAGQVVRRYVDYGEQVGPNDALFRISDFDPLLCPIQVPERELRRLAVGQRAYLTVETWTGERFVAKVLRISPVVDSATGTVKVTLDVTGEGRLRPGMFARVFVETDTRRDALVVPKSALSLESIGDTVYVEKEGVAQRRDVVLGFTEGERVEIVRGVEAGERVVVVGQDGLSDGTPIQVLKADGASVEAAPAEGGAAGGPSGSGGSGGPSGPGGPAGAFGGELTPERIERMRAMMRERGLTDEQIDERIEAIRKRAGGGDSGSPAAGEPGAAAAPEGDGGAPDGAPRGADADG